MPFLVSGGQKKHDDDDGKTVHAGGGLQLCLWSFSSAILEVILSLGSKTQDEGVDGVDEYLVGGFIFFYGLKPPTRYNLPDTPWDGNMFFSKLHFPLFIHPGVYFMCSK